MEAEVSMTMMVRAATVAVPGIAGRARAARRQPRMMSWRRRR
jgi:hypothetical protein